MRKLLLYALVLPVLFAFQIADVSAQKKSDPRCTAGWMDACIKQCSSRGGQARTCPGFCQGRQREFGCR
jgi:hypothetical protein